MASVVLESVRKTYGDVVAVEDFDLVIEDGSFVVLVGPSGCGKTTTLRMIAGLEEISSGTLRIGGRVVNRVAPRDRDIAMVFQSYALYPHMTVFENLAFGLRLRKVPKDEINQRVAEVAKLLQIDEYLDRKPKALSGGQRQRVAMGRAMVRQPSVFLFDEPLSNLDAKLRVQMRVELGRLHRSLKTTTVYVTHDQVEAMTLAHHIVVMSMGRMQQVGTPVEIYDQPANRFVAGFIGSPQMSFLDAQREDEGGRTYLRAGDIRVPAPEGLPEARELGIGLRPQDMMAGAPEGAGAPSIRVPFKVELVEHMGPEAYAHGHTKGGVALVVRVDPHEARGMEESEVQVNVPLPRVHVFGDEGIAIAHGVG